MHQGWSVWLLIQLKWSALFLSAWSSQRSMERALYAESHRKSNSCTRATFTALNDNSFIDLFSLFLWHLRCQWELMISNGTQGVLATRISHSMRCIRRNYPGADLNVIDESNRCSTRNSSQMLNQKFSCRKMLSPSHLTRSTQKSIRNNQHLPYSYVWPTIWQLWSLAMNFIDFSYVNTGNV